MRRTLPFLGAILGLALVTTGCTAGPEQVAGEAAPVVGATGSPSAPAPTAASASPSAPASASASASVAPKPEPAEDRMVLGPDGMGALKLGMSRKSAMATGMVKEQPVDPDWAPSPCEQDLTLREDDGGLMFHQDLGVVGIIAYPGVATAEGIRIGSSLAQAQRTYKAAFDTEGERSYGSSRVQVPGNSKANYGFTLKDNKIKSMWIELKNQPGCFG